MDLLPPTRHASPRAPRAMLSAALLLSIAATGRPSGAAAADGPLKYGEPVLLGLLEEDKVDESSGLAPSRLKDRVFWTHNDSGGRPRVFALSSLGKDLGHCEIEMAEARDWEDMASFVDAGKSYLLIGDVGDNARDRDYYTLYVIEEPPTHPDGKKVKDAKIVQTIHFVYPSGANNCESIAVDPQSDKVLLITKTFQPLCKVYSLDRPRISDEGPTTFKLVAKKIATLPILLATAMDISPDGRRAVVATKLRAYQYVRKENESWTDAFSRPGQPIKIPSLRQCESICYGTDGKTLYLTSEKRPTPLYEIPAK